MNKRHRTLKNTAWQNIFEKKMVFDCGRLPVDSICHTHVYKKQDHKIYEDRGTTKIKEKFLKVSIYDHKILKLLVSHQRDIH